MGEISNQQLRELFADDGCTLFDQLLHLGQISDDYRKSILQSVQTIRDDEGSKKEEIVEKIKAQSDYLAERVNKVLAEILLDEEAQLDEKLNLSWEIIAQDASSRKICYRVALTGSDQTTIEEHMERASTEVISLADYRSFCEDALGNFDGTEEERLRHLHQQVVSDYSVDVSADIACFTASLYTLQADEL